MLYGLRRFSVQSLNAVFLEAPFLGKFLRHLEFISVKGFYLAGKYFCECVLSVLEEMTDKPTEKMH